MKKNILFCLCLNIFYLYAEVVHLPDGTIYTGEMINGLFNGNGVQTRNGKILYDGEFKDGLYNGKGKLITEAYVYEGYFSKGIIDGHGKITYYNKQKYEGDFKNSVYDGMGVLEDSNGAVYTGDFKKHFRNGKGKQYREKRREGGRLDGRNINKK